MLDDTQFSEIELLLQGIFQLLLSHCGHESDLLEFRFRDFQMGLKVLKAVLEAVLDFDVIDAFLLIGRIFGYQCLHIDDSILRFLFDEA